MSALNVVLPLGSSVLSFVFAASVYTLVALSAQFISVATHNSGPGVVGMLAISLFAGFVATIISSAIAYDNLDTAQQVAANASQAPSTTAS